MPVSRLSLAHLPTPIERMDHLAAELGRPKGSLWVKRDDATGLAGGGNKARKLEYLCADAVAQGCDTLVTGGARQSNHVRITAAAANRLGLRCVVVLAGDVPERPTGNVLLDYLLGPEIVWAGELGYYELERAIDAASEKILAEGGRPYPVPIGGASAIGALGYVEAARELAHQLPSLDLVVVADGTGGTHAGLAAGFGDHARVMGVDVGARPDLDEQVGHKSNETARLAGLPEPVGQCVIDHEHVGEGYGAPTDSCLEALEISARLEGLVLDPVYSGKAMAGLIAASRQGRIPTTSTLVFLHTGGMPALFAETYAAWFRHP
jgi:D-cysteine desulfhydrase family pyridoxal phosphate-dependent enzyme